MGVPKLLLYWFINLGVGYINAPLFRIQQQQPPWALCESKLEIKIMEVVLKFLPPTVDRGVDALTEFYQDPTWNLQHANDVFYLKS